MACFCLSAGLLIILFSLSPTLSEELAALQARMPTVTNCSPDSHAFETRFVCSYNAPGYEWQVLDTNIAVRDEWNVGDRVSSDELTGSGETVNGVTNALPSLILAPHP